MLQNSKNIILNNSMSKLKKSVKEIFNELYIKNGIVVKINFKINNENKDNYIDDDTNINDDNNSKNIFFKLSKSIDIENISTNTEIIHDDLENDIININTNNTNNDFDLDKIEIQSTNSSLSLSFCLIDIDDCHHSCSYYENWQCI